MTRPVAILAGGLATRLLPVTQSIPKALVEVGGRPFAEQQIDLLRRHGLTDIVFLVGHLGEMVRDTLGDGARYGVRLRYVFDGPRPLGTGGALKAALPHLGDSFFVLYGDSYLDCDYTAVGRAFDGSGKSGLMTVCRNDDRWDRSNVVFEQGRIVAYSKTAHTSAMRHIDYGLGVLTAAALAPYREDEAFDLARVYQELLAKDDLAAFEVPGRFYEIGSHAGLAETRALLSRRAVFLDRDGVLTRAVIRDGKPFAPHAEEDLELTPGAADALDRLKRAGFVLVVVTNQPDIARGAMDASELDAMHARLRATLPLDDVRVCLHDDADECRCRKPKSGLLEDAARDHHISLADSYMVGDRWRDVEAGRGAGCRTVFLDYGYDEKRPDAPDATVRSLPEAVDWILAREEARS